MASTSTAPDDWTFVKPKSRKASKKHTAKSLRGAQTDATAASKPRTKGLRSVEEIETEYETVRQRWEETGSAEKLRDAAQREVAKIGKGKISSAVCFGLGTFDPEDGAWGQKRMSFIQLAAFLVMVDELEKNTRDAIPCVFQDPICTQSDKDFLSNLGHQVVDAPAGIDSIDEDCFFYAVHLYRPVYAAVVQKALPKIFVGTDFVEWEKSSMDDLQDLAPLRRMEESYHKTTFPCDADVIFHGTVIYARPGSQDVAKSKEEEQQDSTPDSAAPEDNKTQTSVEEDLASKLASTKID